MNIDIKTEWTNLIYVDIKLIMKFLQNSYCTIAKNITAVSLKIKRKIVTPLYV